MVPVESNMISEYLLPEYIAMHLTVTYIYRIKFYTFLKGSLTAIHPHDEIPSFHSCLVDNLISLQFL